MEGTDFFSPDMRLLPYPLRSAVALDFVSLSGDVIPAKAGIQVGLRQSPVEMYEKFARE